MERTSTKRAIALLLLTLALEHLALTAGQRLGDLTGPWQLFSDDVFVLDRTLSAEDLRTLATKGAEALLLNPPSQWR